VRRPVKLALLIAAIPVGLLLVAAVAVSLLVDAESLRPRAEAELSRRLGRKVELGRASVSVWSGIALRAESLSIGEPLSGPAPGVPLVKAGKTAVHVALFPLLRREIQARSIRIEDAKVTQDGRAVVSDLDVDSALKVGADGSLETGGDLEGAVDALAGRPALSASFAATLRGGVLAVPKLEAKVGAMKLGAQGRVEGVAAEAPHLVADVTIALPRSSAKGPIDLTLHPEGPRVRFELDAELLDVDEVSAAISTGLSRSVSAGLSLVPEARAAAPAENLWIPRTSGTGTLRAKKVRVSGMDLADMSAKVAIDRGRVNLNDTSVAAYGGTAKGRAELRPFETDRPFTADQRATGVSLAALLASLAPAQKGTMDGTASLEVALRGRAGAKAMLPTIDGHGYLEVKNGTLKSVGVIPQVMTLLESAGAKGVAKDETPFERLSAHFDVAKGIARTHDLQFRSADLDLDGGGTIAEKGKLDLDVTASFSKPVSAQLIEKTPALAIRAGEDGRLTVPLEVKGTLASPSVRLDVDRVINEGLRKKLQKDTKKKLLDKLFGR
jgi:uncharacterized protein involved in outer membrane biogenesis